MTLLKKPIVFQINNFFIVVHYKFVAVFFHTKMANPWSGGIDGTDGLDLQPSSSSSSSSGTATDSMVAKEGNNHPKRVNKVSGQEASPTISAWTSGDAASDGLHGAEASRPQGKKMAVSWAEMIRAWPKTTLCEFLLRWGKTKHCESPHWDCQALWAMNFANGSAFTGCAQC